MQINAIEDGSGTAACLLSTRNAASPAPNGDNTVKILIDYESGPKATTRAPAGIGAGGGVKECMSDGNTGENMYRNL